MLERMVAQQAQGASEKAASDEDFASGMFILWTGLPFDDGTSEKVGVLPGLMGLQRATQREFAAIEGEEH
jgi:hypothetical protein